MTQFVLLTAIVPHDKGDIVTQAAAAAGAGGGTVMMGRGTASSQVLAVLGLGETSKDIAYIVVPSERKEIIRDAICKRVSNAKPHFGILYSLPVESMFRAGSYTGGDVSMLEEKSHVLITVILNRGYADDAMAAARKAGAGGGTIINARGTAREEDAKFFGMHIVPEKEMLMILVERDKEQQVLDAVKVLPCLSEPGSGIVFCAGVDDFTILGKVKDNA